jgi:non-canonical purine NTP pyrophosphatase (RdgB/HAM1 family)
MSKIAKVEPQQIDMEALVREKIKHARDIIPADRPFFVEHTGLIIHAWNGLPGGLTRQFMDRVCSVGICRMLDGFKDRIARVKTIIGYYYDQNSQMFEGTATGRIALEPRGTAGFGWDDIFIPEGSTRTYAEMGLKEKNRISMRSEATSRFQEEFLLHYFETDGGTVKPISIAEDVQTTGVSLLNRARIDRPSIVKILLLAANPTDTTRLRFDEEIRSIKQVLRQSEYRNRFDIKDHLAVRVADIQEYLLDYKPHIVHFTGSGGKSREIILENEFGESHPVSTRALSQLFRVLKDNIRCVVLNACYSERQAKAIGEHIDCVIGMSGNIGDRSAICFSKSFYRALGFGKSVKTAFDLGRMQIDLENFEQQDIPELLSLKQDPENIFLV